MARRRAATRRFPDPDPVFGSPEISRFINRVMQRGKKTVAQRIVYGALAQAEQDLQKPGLEVFALALKNSAPLLEVKPRRVGGATYQVPIEVRPSRSEAMAMSWIIDAARGRSGQPMVRKLASELTEAYRGQGAAVKKREDLHRMAEANRAFAHYRW